MFVKGENWLKVSANRGKTIAYTIDSTNNHGTLYPQQIYVWADEGLRDRIVVLLNQDRANDIKVKIVLAEQELNKLRRELDSCEGKHKPERYMDNDED
jgi:hypothetical protein